MYSIATLLSDCITHEKAAVQLRIHGKAEPLSITCANPDIAESIADLIDGHCRLHAHSNRKSIASLWTRKGKSYISIITIYTEMFTILQNGLTKFLFSKLPHYNTKLFLLIINDRK